MYHQPVPFSSFVFIGHSVQTYQDPTVKSDKSVTSHLVFTLLEKFSRSSNHKIYIFEKKP